MPTPDTYRTNLILFVLMTSVTLWAAPLWHVPEADFRLTITENWKRKNTVLVRLPREFQNWQMARAYTGQGREVGCRIIQVQEQSLAVEIAISNELMANDSIRQLYVYPSTKPSSITNIIGQPVTCSYVGESFVARPADCFEMDHYLKTHPPAPYYRTLPSFPVKTYGIHLFYKLQQRSTQQQVNFRSLKVRALLSANLYTQSAETLSFAIGNVDTGPWYLFMNNKPVFSWGNTVQMDGKLLRSQSVTTTPGLNKLDLFVFPDRSEMFPLLLLKRPGSKAFKVIPREDLFSSNECSGYRVDHRESGILCSFRLKRKTGVYYRESERQAFPFRISLPPDHTGPMPVFSIKGKKLTPNENSLAFTLDKEKSQLDVTISPKAKLNKLSFPIVADHFKTRESIIKYRLTTLPFFEPVEDRFYVSYKITANHGISPLPGGAGISIAYLNKDGALLSEVMRPVPISPFKYEIDIDRSIEGLHVLETSVHINGVQVSNAFRIYMVNPSEALNFKPTGGPFLQQEGGFAILTRQRGTVEIKPPPPHRSERVTLVDGFIANAEHPLDPPPVIRVPTDSVKIKHLPVNSRSKDQPKSHALLCTLSEALATDTDAIIVATPEDVIASLDFRDQRELAIFIIKSVRDANKHVILVSNPYSGGAEKSVFRNYALMLKEVGRSLDVPIVDLYSASMRTNDTGRFWNLSQTGDFTIHTTAPRATGQQWMLSKIYDLLELAQ